MMKSRSLDELLPRTGTQSIKFDHKMVGDRLPMWVADMDFPVAEEIVQAAIARAEHPIFGYSYLPEELFTAFLNWQRIRHGIAYPREGVRPYFNVLAAIALILNAFSAPGDGITIMTPVYSGFWDVLKAAGRTAVPCPLVDSESGYHIDFADLDACFSRSKAFLMCSPHNPVGRVWTRDELGKIATLAEKHHLLVIADEIHSDLILPPHRQIPFLSLPETDRKNTIALLSATKTFNLAHSGMCFFVTEDPGLGKRIKAEMTRYHLEDQNLFAAVMVRAAYEHGAPWLERVLEYVGENARLIEKALREKMPLIRMLPLEGTYLVWLDCRKLPLGVVEFFETRSRILGEDGLLFGPDGAGYYRLNIATPRRNVETMLDRMEDTYRKCGLARH